MKYCSFDNCQNSSQAKGFCDKHYRRYLKYGDPSKVYKFIPKKCSATDCSNNSKSKGLCDKHYRRFTKTGSYELIKNKNFCSIDKCERRHVAKGFCRLHYEANRQKIKIDQKSQYIIDNHNGDCDICGSSVTGFSRKRLCIDHDHTTGNFRGLLCQKCNIGIGNFNDSPELLLRAIEYLKK